MNGGTNGSTYAESLVQESHESYIYTLLLGASVALLIYTTILKFSQEVEHIWDNRCSLPALLYILTRYGSLIDQIIFLVGNVLPVSTLLRSCDVVANAVIVFAIVSYIGIQGSLIMRAYALCRGCKLITTVLALNFFSGFILLIIINVPKAYQRCTPNSGKPAAYGSILTLIYGACVIFLDLVVFCVGLYSVWDTWRLKRRAGIQRGNDLVSVFLNQILTRFFFAVLLLLTVALAELHAFDLLATNIATLLQNCLSVILIADFTLDLRQCNSRVIEASDLSSSRIESVGVPRFREIHQSVLEEMGDHEISDIRNEYNMDTLNVNDRT